MVENDVNVMDVGAASPNECGHGVVSVGTADEGIETVREGITFDLLFSDIVTPGEMNGIALAGEIRRLRLGLSIPLTSGGADLDRNHREEGRGYAFIGKPCRYADRARKIQLLFNGPDKAS